MYLCVVVVVGVGCVVVDCGGGEVLGVVGVGGCGVVLWVCCGCVEVLGLF